MKVSAALLIVCMFIIAGCNASPTANATLTAAPAVAPTLAPATSAPTLVDSPTAPPTDLNDQTTPTNPPPDTIPAPSSSPVPAAPKLAPGTPLQLDEIHMFDVNHGWGLSKGAVLLTADGAQTWREVTPPITMPAGSQIQVQGIFLNIQQAWVVFSIDNQIASDAVVWHTSDSGQTWLASAPLNHQAYGDQVWAEFSALDETHLWLMMRGVYVGAGTHYATQFFRTTDGGLTWLPLAGDVGVDYTGLVFGDADHGLLTWQTTGAYEAGPPAYAITSDGAVNWEVRELPPPTAAPTLFTDSPYCEPFQPHLSADLATRILVGCFDEYDPPHVFSSYLYTSPDGGATWTSTRLPDNVLASADTLWFFDSNNALLLGRDIYNSADGGQTWAYVKSVNWDGQFTFVDSQTGWAIARANHESALVKTSNGGANWIQIKPVIAP